MAECAYASLIFTSFNDIPSLVCVDPNYLNWFTSSGTFSFIHMLADHLGLMLLTRIAVSMHQLFSSAFQWFVTVLLCCIPEDRCRRQTGNCKAAALRFPLMWQILLHYSPRNISNIGITGDNGHPCRATTVIWHKSSTLPFSNDALFASSYNDLMISIGYLSTTYCCKSRSMSFLIGTKWVIWIYQEPFDLKKTNFTRKSISTFATAAEVMTSPATSSVIQNVIAYSTKGNKTGEAASNSSATVWRQICLPLMTHKMSAANWNLNGTACRLAPPFGEFCVFTARRSGSF